MTEHVYYRCKNCGEMTPAKQIAPTDDLGPYGNDCDCWKGPNWERGVWRPEKEESGLTKALRARGAIAEDNYRIQLIDKAGVFIILRDDKPVIKPDGETLAFYRRDDALDWLAAKVASDVTTVENRLIYDGEYPYKSTYTGAPDECAIHWPTKLVDGDCPACALNTPTMEPE